MAVFSISVNFFSFFFFFFFFLLGIIIYKGIKKVNCCEFRVGLFTASGCTLHTQELHFQQYLGGMADLKSNPMVLE